MPKFSTQYTRESFPGINTGSESPTDPYQFTPTGLLFAQSMEAGARSKIAMMDNYIYSESEDLESDDVTPLDIYPPDIADAYQAVRLYRGKIRDAEKVYKESLNNSKKDN